MADPILFYFDFSSPYAYFAAHEIGALGDRVNRPVAWKPFLLGAAFKHTNMRAGTDLGYRFDYMKRDWQRIARRAALPFCLPDPFPFAAIAPSRAVLWAEREAGAERAQALALALFDAAFGDGRPIGDGGETAAVAATVGFDPAAVEAGIQDPTIKTALKTDVEAGIRAGVFGSPMLLVDGEPFWGYDRLPMAEDWARESGW